MNDRDPADARPRRIFWHAVEGTSKRPQLVNPSTIFNRALAAAPELDNMIAP